MSWPGSTVQRLANGWFARQPIAHGTYPGLRQHERHGVPATPECGCRAAYNAYKRGRHYADRRGTCSNCKREDVAVVAHEGQDYCKHACYQRWKLNGFEGEAPPPPAGRAIDTAREYADVIMNLSTEAAAWRVGVTQRTIMRYRRLLEEDDAAAHQGDREQAIS